jgi:hypothetical protein
MGYKRPKIMRRKMESILATLQNLIHNVRFPFHDFGKPHASTRKKRGRS